MKQFWVSDSEDTAMTWFKTPWWGCHSGDVGLSFFGFGNDYYSSNREGLNLHKVLREVVDFADSWIRQADRMNHLWRA